MILRPPAHTAGGFFAWNQGLPQDRPPLCQSGLSVSASKIEGEDRLTGPEFRSMLSAVIEHLFYNCAFLSSRAVRLPGAALNQKNGSPTNSRPPGGPSKIKKNGNPLRGHRFSGGGGWIRTTEAKRNRFTVCPLWPLGNSSICSCHPASPAAAGGLQNRSPAQRVRF